MLQSEHVGYKCAQTDTQHDGQHDNKNDHGEIEIAQDEPGVGEEPANDASPRFTDFVLRHVPGDDGCQGDDGGEDQGQQPFGANHGKEPCIGSNAGNKTDDRGNAKGFSCFYLDYRLRFDNRGGDEFFSHFSSFGYLAFIIAFTDVNYNSGIETGQVLNSIKKDFHHPFSSVKLDERLICVGKGVEMSEKKIRVLVAKPGLDGHDRGAKVVARALRDAGMEVIYTGLRQTPAMIAEAALQEDVDVIGLSILSGAHLALVPKVVDLVRANGQDNVRIFVGGIIPDEDIPALKEAGVHAIYGPGTATTKIVQDILAENPA